MNPRVDAEQPDFALLTSRVYRLCRALLPSESEARDAAQESLLRAWSRRARLREGVSWWTWTAGFAIRVCREARRRPGAVVSGIEATDRSPAPAEDDGDVDRKRLERLHSAIGRLPDRQREVVILRVLLGQSTEEAAQTLGCPVGTVKSNLHKAIRRLRATVVSADATDAVRRK